MTTERIKEIQSKTAYPESVSVQQALLQVWNECEQEQLRLHIVISRFFKEMAEKHNVKVDDLNIHISYNQLYIQEYTPNQRNEFKCLEIVDLNGL